MDPEASFRRALVPSVSGLTAQVSPGKKESGKRASRHLNPRVCALGFPRNERGSNGPRSKPGVRSAKHHRQPSAIRTATRAAAGEGSGPPAQHLLARPFQGLAPGAAKSFQPKSSALARTANRLAAPKNGWQSRPRRLHPQWRLPQPTPAAEVHLPQSLEKSSSGKSSSSSGGGVGGCSKSPAPRREAEESCALPPPGHSGAGRGVRAIPHPPPGPLSRPPPGSPGPGASGSGRRLWKVRRARPQLPALAPSLPADTRRSAGGCLDTAVADATAEAEAGAARRRRRHSPPPGTRPLRTPGNSERTTPPHARGGKEADPQSRRPTRPPSPRNSISRLIPGRKPCLLPPRPPTHAPPLSKKKKTLFSSTLITGFLPKQSFERDRKIWNRLVSPAPRSCLVSPLPCLSNGLAHSTPSGSTEAPALTEARAAGQSRSALASPGWRSPSGGDLGRGGVGRGRRDGAALPLPMLKVPV